MNCYGPPGPSSKTSNADTWSSPQAFETDQENLLSFHEPSSAAKPIINLLDNSGAHLSYLPANDIGTTSELLEGDAGNLLLDELSS